ncbi:MAG: hypothetical protein ABWK53_04460 [Anaerolineales bacterium]
MKSLSADRPLRRRDLLVLFILALLTALAVAALQPVPGYMDAAYYYAGGLALARRLGFQEPFLWNYLDHPQSLPHPSHSYWYPLASLAAAGGMTLLGRTDFAAARLLFVLAAALSPPLTALLAWRLSSRRGVALTAGWLAVFSGYYLPFIATTDNYSFYLLFGTLYFLLLAGRWRFLTPFGLGLLAGLLNLARSDGLLWLPLTLSAVLFFPPRPACRCLGAAGMALLLALTGYLLVMGPWFWRNLQVFGAPLPPGGRYVLWMTEYGQIFSFRPERFTFQAWLAAGWESALAARLEAFAQNLGTAFAAQGLIFLAPLIAAGAWQRRREKIVRLAACGWLLLLLAESLLFPFASVRGGFFHAGAAFQPLWFVLAPLGLDELVARSRLRRLGGALQASLALMAVLFSLFLVQVRVVASGWNEGEYVYRQAEAFLVGAGALPGEVVMTRNPPAYYVMTGRPAIVIPNEGVPEALAAARRFEARYLVLERPGPSGALRDLYDHPENYSGFDYLGELDETRIFRILLSP